MVTDERPLFLDGGNRDFSRKLGWEILSFLEDEWRIRYDNHNTIWGETRHNSKKKIDYYSPTVPDWVKYDFGLDIRRRRSIRGIPPLRVAEGEAFPCQPAAACKGNFYILRILKSLRRGKRALSNWPGLGAVGCLERELWAVEVDGKEPRRSTRRVGQKFQIWSLTRIPILRNARISIRDA